MKTGDNVQILRQSNGGFALAFALVQYHEICRYSEHTQHPSITIGISKAPRTQILCDSPLLPDSHLYLFSTHVEPNVTGFTDDAAVAPGGPPQIGSYRSGQAVWHLAGVALALSAASTAKLQNSNAITVCGCWNDNSYITM